MKTKLALMVQYVDHDDDEAVIVSTVTFVTKQGSRISRKLAAQIEREYRVGCSIIAEVHNLTALSVVGVRT